VASGDVELLELETCHFRSGGSEAGRSLEVAFLPICYVRAFGDADSVDRGGDTGGIFGLILHAKLQGAEGRCVIAGVRFIIGVSRLEFVCFLYEGGLADEALGGFDGEAQLLAYTCRSHLSVLDAHGVYDNRGEEAGNDDKDGSVYYELYEGIPSRISFGEIREGGAGIGGFVLFIHFKKRFCLIFIIYENSKYKMEILIPFINKRE
jgi:hypothetical protein